MAIVRAYSVLDVKEMTDENGKRRFSGIATTPSTDRMGDIVEPKGCELKLPLPLLWQHSAREPIGWVKAARVSDAGIEVDCEVAKIEEAGKLKDRLDECWQMLRAKLVRGLSIGFNALESARIEGTYGYRYLKWQMLELSCVTLAANQDATVTSLKSADQAYLSAASRAGTVVRLDPRPVVTGQQVPGASGPVQARRKGVVYLS